MPTPGDTDIVDLSGNGMGVDLGDDEITPDLEAFINALASNAGAGMVGSATGNTVEARLTTLDLAIDDLLYLLGPTTLASIFTGNKGAWWDTTRLDKFYQNVADVTPNVVSGNPVGKWVNTYGANQPLTETTATASKRPVFTETVEGIRKVVFDGVNDRITNTAIDLTGAPAGTIIAVIAHDDPTINGVLAEWGWFPSGVGAAGIALNGITAGSVGIGVRDTTGNFYFGNDLSDTTDNRNLVLIWDIDTGAIDAQTVMINGEVRALTQAAISGTTQDNFMNATRQLDIGGRAGDTNFASGGLIAYGIVPRLLTDVEKQIVTAYGARLGQIAIVEDSDVPYETVVSSFDNTTLNLNLGTHIQTSPLATVTYQTSATTLRLHAYTDIASAFAVYSEIGVEVNGVYYRAVLFGPDGSRTSIITLPVGDKTVRFTNSGQTRPGGVPLGCYLVSIDSNAPMTRVIPTINAKRVHVLGDSITTGANAVPATQYGYVVQIRRDNLDVDIIADGFGFGGYQNFASDPTQAAATAARTALANPTHPMLLLGTNDYGLPLQSAADAALDAGRLLDAYHVAMPSRQLYLATPLTRTVETANAFGDTLGAYRTAFNTVVAARAWSTSVSGPALMTAGGLDADGIHPSNAGHTTLGTAIPTALGV